MLAAAAGAGGHWWDVYQVLVTELGLCSHWPTPTWVTTFWVCVCNLLYKIFVFNVLFPSWIWVILCVTLVHWDCSWHQSHHHQLYNIVFRADSSWVKMFNILIGWFIVLAAQVSALWLAVAMVTCAHTLLSLVDILLTIITDQDRSTSSWRLTSAASFNKTSYWLFAGRCRHVSIYCFLDPWKTQSKSQSMLLCRSIDRKSVLMILDSWHCNALDVEINTHHCLDRSPPTLHQPGNNKSNHQGLEIFVNLVQQNSSFDSSAGTISHCRHLFSFPLHPANLE